MKVITHYCDRCNEEKEEKELLNLKLEVAVPSGYHTDYSIGVRTTSGGIATFLKGWRRDLCSECASKVGLITEILPSMIKSEVDDKLHDVIIDLVANHFDLEG